MSKNMYGLPNHIYLVLGGFKYTSDPNGLIANVLDEHAPALEFQRCMDEDAWLKLQAAHPSAGGITQLTGDVTAGPGSDSYYVDFWRLWMNALRNTQPHLLAYLIYMVQRLLFMKSLLRPTGSIYLHCDPTASHYIKVMMDGIFGHQNFRNEIVWKRTFAHGGATRWGDIHDTILFYTKSDQYTWNRVLQAHDASYLQGKYRFDDSRGRHRLVVLTGPGITKGASGQPWRG